MSGEGLAQPGALEVFGEEHLDRFADATHSPSVAAGVPPAARRGPWLLITLLLGGVAGVTLVTLLLGVSTDFPGGWRLPVGEWVEQFTYFFIDSFSWLYLPITAALDGLVAWVLYGLYAVPAVLLSLGFVLVAWRLAGPGVAILTVVTVVLTVGFGLWDPMKETLALMTVAVIVASLLGVAIGVVGSVNRHAENFVRVVLDAMQTYPMFAYLVPALVIFGPGTTAALVVTVIWATPPIARMTLVGIRGIPGETVEAAISQGVTRWQLLASVLFPLARRSIRAGLNQTIMFAITMAIIASMIGAGGLGDPVWVRLRLLQFGPALEAGLILVLMAIILDRVSSASRGSDVPRLPRNRRRIARWPLVGSIYRRGPLAFGALIAAGCIVVIVVANALNLGSIDFSSPPGWMQMSFGASVDTAITWLNVNLGPFFDSFSYVIQTLVINPVINSLSWFPWIATLCGVFAVAYIATGLRVAVLSVGAAFLIGLLGMWEPATYTFGFVAIAAAVTVVLGVPLGILAALSNKFAAAIRPVLDAMQTLPVFLFVIPSVILFGPGPVAGLLATVAFAIPPMIRLTNLAIRGTDAEVVEASVIFGATPSQTLRKVRFPLGIPTILVGLNQAVMLALAMAVVSSFIGTPGLGQQILLSISDGDLALGAEAGLAMFLVATVIDRVLQGGVRKLVPGSPR